MGAEGWRKEITFLTSILVISLIIIPPHATDSVSKVKLTLWYSWRGDVAKALKEAVMAFEKLEPEAMVELHYIPINELKARLLYFLSQGKGPDLFLGPHIWIGELASKGALLSLNELFTKELRGKFLRTAIDAATYKGLVYGVPILIEVPTLWYHVDLVEVPPQTLDDLFSLMWKFKLFYDNKVYAFVYNVKDPYISSCWFNSLGAYFFNPKNMTSNVGSPEGVKAFTIVANIGKYMPSGVDDESVLKLFINRRAAMIIYGPQAIAKIAGKYEIPDEVNLTLIPKVDKNWGAPYMSVECAFLTKSAGRRGSTSLAFKLAYFLGSRGAIILAKRALCVPAYKPALRIPGIGDNVVIRAFFEQAKHALPAPNLPLIYGILNVTSYYLGRMWGGAMRPKEAATALQAALMREIRAGN